MMREFGQMIVDLIERRRFERETDPLVQDLAPLDQQRVVGDFLRQRVLEGVLDIADRRLLVDELAQLQIVEHAVQLVVGLRDHLAHQRQAEILVRSPQAFAAVPFQPAADDRCAQRGSPALSAESSTRPVA